MYVCRCMRHSESPPPLTWQSRSGSESKHLTLKLLYHTGTGDPKPQTLLLSSYYYISGY